MKRSIAIVAALVGLVVLVPSAAADSGDGSTTTTEPPVTTTTEVPKTDEPTTTTEVPPTTTTVPPTTTNVPTTTTPTCADCDNPPCTVDCIPEASQCIGADCIPSAGGGTPTATLGSGTLPFTGIEDVIAPLLLALVVVLGGVVAWRWAQLRESVAIDAQRARPLPAREARSGYAAALRRQAIEQRARQVFIPRVA